MPLFQADRKHEGQSLQGPGVFPASMPTGPVETKRIFRNITKSKLRKVVFIFPKTCQKHFAKKLLDEGMNESVVRGPPARLPTPGLCAGLSSRLQLPARSPVAVAVRLL